MKEVRSIEDVMLQISNMNKENSICQFVLPGKGRFIIVLQEQDDSSTHAVIQNPYLEQNVIDSTGLEKQIGAMSASELMRNPFL
ncbi:hypothetical protein GC096_25495 [Paenibacillus sp. LMG 31461]|uniref:Uncharacterized protein n=1 Tax=Paenibacillus plantarum TaxID=2654975 RepID=A0ABX1XGI3_9BACL|nr:hypothetical protein [Paenibacillus plantarum]NOU67404.1 hypothetical protein [Paenibacillus plantarum]